MKKKINKKKIHFNNKLSNKIYINEKIIKIN